MYADHVFCCNCESEMFVPCGADICPRCRAIGTMMWVDEDEQEIEVSEDEIEAYTTSKRG